MSYQSLLSDEIALIREPLKNFYDLVWENTDEGELYKFLLVLNKLLQQQDRELHKIFEAINRTLGKVILEGPAYREITGAIIKPVNPQAHTEEWELDPITADNLKKDLAALEAASNAVMFHVEGIYHDLGLEVSPGLKERIVRENVARDAGGAA